MASFNVLSQPWIPTEDLDGRYNEHGILDLIKNAHKLRSIADASPLFQYGMYRLLIAFLTDAIRPESVEELLDLLDEGAFPSKLIEKYVNERLREGNCFDLFDPEQPFLQSKWDNTLDTGMIRSVALMVHHLPSGNNSVHYDHRFQGHHAFCPEICARALTAVNVFCTAGTQGPSGINGAPPWYVLINGKNLFETLLLNLYIPDGSIPLAEPPVSWRNRNPVQPKAPVSRTSYLYGLTWQSRRICLLPEDKPGSCTLSGRGSKVLVRNMAFQAGWKFEGYQLWRDPHSPRQVGTDMAGNVTVSTIKPREGRAAWRDLGALVLANGIEGRQNRTFYRPQAVQQYVNSLKPALGDKDSLINIEAYGLSTNQASLISWVHDSISIYDSLAEVEEKARLILDELQLVEKIAYDIRRALNRLRPKRSSLRGNSIEETQMRFFGQVRPLFLGRFQERVATADETVPNWRSPVLKEWREELKKLSSKVFEDGLSLMSTSAREWEVSVEARNDFYKRLKSNLNLEGGEKE